MFVVMLKVVIVMPSFKDEVWPPDTSARRKTIPKGMFIWIDISPNSDDYGYLGLLKNQIDERNIKSLTILRALAITLTLKEL